jgi:hypothetical protein
MSFPMRLVGAVLVLGLAACAGAPTRTHTNYDPTSVREVGSFHTYAWLPVPEGADPRIYNPTFQARVQQAVDRKLRARGYQKVDQDPDFKVGWHGALEDKVGADVIDPVYGYTWDPWFDPFFGPVAFGGGGVPEEETAAREYEQGTLILDVVDARSNKLVWRGTAQAALSESMEEGKSQKLIDSAVDELLKKFPPKPRMRSGWGGMGF